jgi:putative spermidine/putrescine transport system ATP-binding protein
MNTDAVTLRDVAFAYPGAAAGAVDAINLALTPGEIVTVVGPSGCGKSTLLRIVAGLLKPTAGRVEIGGVDVTDLPTHRRNLGWVPQSYALFENLDVLGNVQFGPRMRALGRAEQLRIANEMLALCRIAELARRNVADLSGGQRQRVTIARALAAQPRVLLLDEPLAALDPQLRAALRVDLKGLLRDIGLTTLFVTHDQTEAMTMADRVVVMRAGRVEQFDAPEAIWRRPNSGFVASFFGADVLRVRVLGDGCCEIAPGLTAALESANGASMPHAEQCEVAVRATDWVISDHGAAVVVRACDFSGGAYAIDAFFADAPTNRIALVHDRRAVPGEQLCVELREGHRLRAL